MLVAKFAMYWKNAYPTATIAGGLPYSLYKHVLNYGAKDPISAVKGSARESWPILLEASWKTDR